MMAAERDIPNEEHDEVTEAGLESFPASDPPSYNMPARHRFVPKEPAAPSIETLAKPAAATGAGRPGSEQREAEGRLTERETVARPPPERPATAAGSTRFTVWVAGVSVALLVLGLVALR